MRAPADCTAANTSEVRKPRAAPTTACSTRLTINCGLSTVGTESTRCGTTGTSFAASVIASSPSWTTWLSVTVGPSVIARHEGGDDQPPAVDEHEQQHLERKRDGHRGQHHHAQRHQ